MLIYSVAQVQSFERHLLDRGVITHEGLLSAAFASLWRHISPEITQSQRVLVLCGKGYNGADGLMLALHLHRHDYDVALCMVDSSGLKQHTASLLEAAHSASLPVVSEPDFPAYDVCVDAMYGIGFSDQRLKPRVRALISKLNAWQGFCISIDCPSGLNADTGVVTDIAVRADMTVMLLLPKRGLYAADAYDYTGRLIFDDCESGDFDLQPDTSHCALVHPDQQLFGPYSSSENVDKRDFGRVLVVGGNVGMHGAAVLCATAAARVGCGHISLLVRDASLVTMNFDYTTVALADLETLLKSGQITSIVVGPGLGQDDWALCCLRQCLSVCLPSVIDADALRLLAKHSVQLHAQVVLTPHQGEAAALLGESLEWVKHGRFAAANALIKKYDCLALLKGPGPIVAHKDMMRVIDVSCPGLAVAGTGDVLAGILGGLIAQRKSVDMNVVLDALLVHCQVGLYWQSLFSGRGMMASDMLSVIANIKNGLIGDYDSDRD